MRVGSRLLPLVLVWVPASAEAGDCNVQDEGGGGCPEGECCYLDPDEVPTCVAVGEGEQDDACAASPQCSCGYTCVGTKEEATCAHWCGVRTPDDALCPEPARCTRTIEGVGGEHLGFACKTPDLCNPLTQDCPEPGDGCYVTDPEDGATDCWPAGDGRQGDECSSGNDCAAGYGCANQVCMEFCNPDNGNADCDVGSCVDREWTVPGGEDPVGYCVEDSGPDADSDVDGDTDTDADADGDEGGCGCRAAGPVGPALVLSALTGLLLVRRRR